MKEEDCEIEHHEVTDVVAEHVFLRERQRLRPLSQRVDKRWKHMRALPTYSAEQVRHVDTIPKQVRHVDTILNIPKQVRRLDTQILVRSIPNQLNLLTYCGHYQFQQQLSSKTLQRLTYTLSADMSHSLSAKCEKHFTSGIRARKIWKQRKSVLHCG